MSSRVPAGLLFSPRRIRFPAGAAAVDLRLPGGSARCVLQSAVGRGESRRAGEPAGAGGAPSEVGRWMPRSAREGRTRTTEARFPSPRDEGDRSRRARVERRTASAAGCRGRAERSAGRCGRRSRGGDRGRVTPGAGRPGAGGRGRRPGGGNGPSRARRRRGRGRCGGPPGGCCRRAGEHRGLRPAGGWSRPRRADEGDRCGWCRLRDGRPRTGRPDRRGRNQRHGGGRRRGPDRGGARQLAEEDRRVDLPHRRGRGGSAPGQVLAARTGTPEGDPAGERTQSRAQRGARRRLGRGPGEVLAARTGAPERDPARELAQPRDRATLGLGHDGDRRGAGRGRSGQATGPGRGRGQHRPQRRPPDRNAERAGVHRPGRDGSTGRGHGRRLAAAHLASRVVVRDRGRCRGQGEN